MIVIAYLSFLQAGPNRPTSPDGPFAHTKTPGVFAVFLRVLSRQVRELGHHGVAPWIWDEWGLGYLGGPGKPGRWRWREGGSVWSSGSIE